MVDPIEALRKMKERILTRRRSIDENKEGKDYIEYLQNKRKASALRYVRGKRDQKIKDDMKIPQSKIDEYFEVNDDD